MIFSFRQLTLKKKAWAQRSKLSGKILIKYRANLLASA
jgi:hypothetical protein